MESVRRFFGACTGLVYTKLPMGNEMRKWADGLQTDSKFKANAVVLGDGDHECTWFDERIPD